MQAKTLLIPIAAFALSATGVSAFNSDVLHRAGLSEAQIHAFETAHELRKEGDVTKARDVLAQAGIDLSTMESVREAMHEHKDAMRMAIDAAVANNDLQAFKIAVAGSPLQEIVTTQEEFDLFREAHMLHEEGEHKEARKIMEDLGFEPHMSGQKFGHFPHQMNGPQTDKGTE